MEINNKEIFHGRVSAALDKAFGAEFLEKYKLTNIKNLRGSHDIPCVYFGAYTRADISHIQKNKSKFKIIVYGGTDAMNSANLKALRGIENLFHVAISDYISDDLNRLGMPHKKVAITPVVHSKYGLKAEALGSSIYVYTSAGRSNFYGKGIYEQLKRDMPDIDFKICTHSTYSREELISVYKDCFMGLRLVSHDGLPNTVVELGLMGRRTAHNGGLPSGIPWKDVDDLKNIIRAEQKRIGRTFVEVSESTKSFLNDSRDWLNLDFWANRSN